jgi:flagellar basal-body rod modification protein FlgD
MQVTSQATTGTTSNAASAASSSLTSAADQQDRFMKLLVAQMKNQDPLNPMDNAQMTSQIAQINTVSGIEKLNGTVDSLRASFVSLQAQGAAQLVGRDVLVEGTGMQLTESGARAGVELAGTASSVMVKIFDTAGRAVQTLNLGALPAGVKTFAWDGRGADGNKLTNGNYRFTVTAVNGTADVDTKTLAAVGVKAVTTSPAGVQIDLGNSGVLPYADIRSFL